MNCEVCHLKKTISVVIFTFVCEKRKLISRDQNLERGVYGKIFNQSAVGTFRLMVNLGGGGGGGG